MKKALLLLSLAGCVVLPAATRADVITPKSNKAKVTAAAQPAPLAHRVVYYIMPTPRTGSNIPMVYRAYNGRIDSASAAAVYGQDAINITGALSVDAVLNKLEPSITTGGGRR